MRFPIPVPSSPHPSRCPRLRIVPSASPPFPRLLSAEDAGSGEPDRCHMRLATFPPTRCDLELAEEEIDYLFLEARSLVLSVIARRVVDARGGGVLDPRCDREVPGARPAAAGPVGPGVSSCLHVAHLAAAIRAMADVLSQDGVYLCVERQGDGCRLWPGRFPDSGRGAVMAMPSPERSQALGRVRALRLAA